MSFLKICLKNNPWKRFYSLQVGLVLLLLFTNNFQNSSLFSLSKDTWNIVLFYIPIYSIQHSEQYWTVSTSGSENDFNRTDHKQVGRNLKATNKVPCGFPCRESKWQLHLALNIQGSMWFGPSEFQLIGCLWPKLRGTLQKHSLLFPGRKYLFFSLLNLFQLWVTEQKSKHWNK